MTRTLVLAVVLLCSCTATPAEPEGPAPTRAGVVAPTRWERLPDPPLGRREGAIVQQLGHRLVVVGGRDALDCQGFSCPIAPTHRGGAAYDLETGTWSRIARAPRGLFGSWQRAVRGDRLYVMGGMVGGTSARVHAYDAGDDEWSTYPRPPHDYSGDEAITAHGRYVYVTRHDDFPGAGIDRLDLRDGTWVTISYHPGAPRIGLRALFGTRHGLVVAGAVPGAGKGVLPRVEVLRDGDWHRFGPAPEEARGWQWIRSGSVLVATGTWEGDPGAALDLRSGEWEMVPPKPREAGWSIGYAMAPGAYSSDGFTYDAVAGRWLDLDPPTDSHEPGTGAWVGEDLYVVDDRAHAWRLRDVLQGPA